MALRKASQLETVTESLWLVLRMAMKLENKMVKMKEQMKVIL